MYNICGVFVLSVGIITGMEDAETSLYFSIDFWYHIFRENTVRTRFIDVSPEFLDYMLRGLFV